MHYEFKIDKIKCQGCVDAIKKAFSEMSEISEYSADVQSKIVKVTTQLDRRKISDKLAEIGFPENA